MPPRYLGSTTHPSPALFISPCHHLFHTECIVSGWIQQQNKEECPYCRQPLWDKTIYEEIRGQVALELYKDTRREANVGRIDDQEQEQQQQQQQVEDNNSSLAVDEDEETALANATSLESRRGEVEEGVSHDHVQDDEEEQGQVVTMEATDERPEDQE